MLAVGAGEGCLDIFFSHLSFLYLSPSLWETARYRLKYCLKGPLSQKQPTNQPMEAGKGAGVEKLLTIIFESPAILGGHGKDYNGLRLVLWKTLPSVLFLNNFEIII